MSNDKQETIPMGKTVMVLVIPEPKVRKATAKPVRKHKDNPAYSRKAKHKTPEWGSCCVWGAVTGFALRAYPWCERGYEPVEYGR